MLNLLNVIIHLPPPKNKDDIFDKGADKGGRFRNYYRTEVQYIQLNISLRIN